MMQFQEVKKLNIRILVLEIKIAGTDGVGNY